MAVQDTLGNCLQNSPMGVRTKCDIINHLCGSRTTPDNLSNHQLDLDAYFAYYAEQCNSALHNRGKHTFVRTHQDIVDIAHHITNSETRDSIKYILNSKLTVSDASDANDLVESAIDLVASLLVMM